MICEQLLIVNYFVTDYFWAPWQPRARRTGSVFYSFFSSSSGTMEQAVVVAPLGAPVVAPACGNQEPWESGLCAVLLLLLLWLSSSWGKFLCDSCCGACYGPSLGHACWPSPGPCRHPGCYSRRPRHQPNGSVFYPNIIVFSQHPSVCDQEAKFSVVYYCQEGQGGWDC